MDSKPFGPFSFSIPGLRGCTSASLRSASYIPSSLRPEKFTRTLEVDRDRLPEIDTLAAPTKIWLDFKKSQQILQSFAGPDLTRLQTILLVKKLSGSTQKI